MAERKKERKKERQTEDDDHDANKEEAPRGGRGREEGAPQPRAPLSGRLAHNNLSTNQNKTNSQPCPTGRVARRVALALMAFFSLVFSFYVRSIAFCSCLYVCG